jgi:4-diphosphocytidyl-2-C-methyl-D-erythritol kinase
LREVSGCRRGAAIRLVKRIPLAAGLAGGSTDAAATLAGLNRLWRLGLSPAELASLGAQLGSDVAFFFSTPAAWCTGRGERVEPLPLGRPLWFVLVSPPFGLSTAEVYRGVTVPDRPETGEAIRQAAQTGDVEEVGRRLHNRLQAAAEGLAPAVADVHARIRQLSPAGQLLSGSGSTLFALCRDHREALRVARGLRSAEGIGSVGPWGQSCVQTIVRSCS